MRARPVFTILFALVLVVAVVYITSMTVRVAAGITHEAASPEYRVRLRLVDAGGGAVTDVETRLRAALGEEFDLAVVEKTSFGVRTLESSFLIRHDDDRRTAAAVARRLGLEADEVVFEPLEYNVNQASLSLVMADDIDSLLLKATS